MARKSGEETDRRSQGRKSDCRRRVVVSVGQEMRRPVSCWEIVGGGREGCTQMGGRACLRRSWADPGVPSADLCGRGCAQAVTEAAGSSHSIDNRSPAFWGVSRRWLSPSATKITLDSLVCDRPVAAVACVGCGTKRAIDDDLCTVWGLGVSFEVDLSQFAVCSRSHKSKPGSGDAL